jgi:hypothetical protein
MWNKSYRYKDTYTVQRKHYKSIHTHTHINPYCQLTLCTQIFKRMTHFYTISVSYQDLQNKWATNLKIPFQVGKKKCFFGRLLDTWKYRTNWKTV